MKIKTFNSICKKNPKGNIIKLINQDDRFTNLSGELYISKINKKKIKAWKQHKKANLNLFVIKGKIKFVIIDSKLKITELVLTENKKNRILIKKNTIFGFQNLHSKQSILLSYSSIKYSKKESKNFNLTDFKYKW